jgi:hypothetical protein
VAHVRDEGLLSEVLVSVSIDIALTVGATASRSA